MGNNNLSFKDFRFKKELPTLYATLIISSILILLMFVVNLIVGIGFLIGIGTLCLNLYLNQVKMLGSCIRVSETQFPEIYRMAKISAERLNMPLPPVFIMQNPILNAFATGFWGNYYVVLHSAIIEALSEDELMWLIGHEFTHVKGNHVMINVISGMGSQQGLAVLPGLAWLQKIIQFVFLFLSRCFEFTCDRGGLISAGDVKPVVTGLAKLAVGPELFKKVNMMEFYQQALALDKSRLGFFAELSSTHPYTINRIRDAVRFYRSNEYRNIAAMQGKSATSTLQGSLATGDLMDRIMKRPDKNQFAPPSVPQHPSSSESCKNCGTPRKGTSNFCVSCGSKFSQSIQDETPPTKEEAAPPNHQEEMKTTKPCKACGSNIKIESLFCTECGNKF
jgi:Zn-dependent protease with chaperone function